MLDNAEASRPLTVPVYSKVIKEFEDSINATSRGEPSPSISNTSPASIGGTTVAAITSASEPIYENATNVDPARGVSAKIILEPTSS